MPAAERYLLDTSAVFALTDREALLLAGRIKAFHRLSFADAIIAAVARLHEAILVHKDPELVVLADEISLLNLPYK